jgi:hypothetical protein
LKFDWYDRRTTGILLKIPIPEFSGFGASVQNAGKVRNKGWEVNAGYNSKSRREYSFGISLNLSNNHNEVLNLKGTGPFINGNSITKVGAPIGSIYGYVAEGYFQSKDEVNDHAKQFNGNAAPGDIKYKDLDDDGFVKASGDRTIIGNPFPRFEFGVTINASYKNFGIKAFFQGRGKRDVLLVKNAAWAFYNGGKIAKWQAEDHWTQDNRNAAYPRLIKASDHNNFKASSKWVYNAAYLRMRNLQINYTLPINSSSGNIKKIKIFVSGRNLFTVFDNMPPGIDPDVPNGSGAIYYPLSRYVGGGIMVNLH